MFVKFIKTIEDLDFVLKGIQFGAIKDKVFTLHAEKKYLKEIMDIDIQFYIFVDKPSESWLKKHKAKDVKFVYVGFGG